MGNVEVIESDGSLQHVGSAKSRRKTLRVAAYCRVSTDLEDQKYSYASQVSYYKSLIEKKKGWSFAGIYADEGISGTMTAKRQSFLQMIDACMDGRIDLIITKSISRFARNTLDVLQYVRKLRDRGVAVYFEEENINTLSMEGEMLLTVLSSVYQQEVENISSHVKKGLQMKMSRGEMVGFHGCMGYDLDKKNKAIVVNAKEAEVVKYIFQRYIEGIGTSMIAHEVERLGWKTKYGRSKWSPSAIRRILTNEKYTGDLLMGKSFTVDPISHRRLSNKGEQRKYLVHDHHPAIIERRIFDKAQEIREKRAEHGHRPKTIGYRMSAPKEYVFSGMIECVFCGSTYTRRIAHAHTPYQKIQWGCMQKALKGKESCPHSKVVDEAAIEKAFVESYAIICRNNEKVIEELAGYVQEYLAGNDIAAKIDKIKKELDTMRGRRDRLIDMRVDDMIGELEYKAKYHQLSEDIANLERDFYQGNKILAQSKDGVKQRMEEIRKVLDNPKDFGEFNPEVFEAVIERVIIGEIKNDGTVDPYKITFIYKTGLRDEKDGTEFKKVRRSKKGQQDSGSGVSSVETISNNLSQIHSNEVGGLSQNQSGDILGIIASFAVPRFANATSLANTAKVQSDLAALDAAITMYEIEKGEAPKEIKDLSAYVMDLDKLKPPKGTCHLKDGKTVVVDDTSYSIKPTGTSPNTQIRAVCEEHTAGDFGK